MPVFGGPQVKTPKRLRRVRQFALDENVYLRSVDMDVQAQESMDMAIQQIVADIGRLDVLIHNAGHMSFGPSEAFTVEQVAELYDVNVLSTQRLNRAALPIMRKQGRVLVVWVGSSSTRGGTPPYLGPYFAAGPHYYEWRSLVRNMPDLPVGQLIRHITPQLTDEEVAAYDAPFTDSRFKAGARTFPELAMVEPEMEGITEAKEALRLWKEEWTGQSFMAIGGKAPDAETMQTLRSQIRGCPAPLVLPDAGHFVPEWGEQVVRAALLSFKDL